MPLIGAYIGIFIVSFSYRHQLGEKFAAEFGDYNDHSDPIPKKMSVWILPIISLLIVLVSQVTMLQEGANRIFSDLSFGVSTAFIMLMIGMELAYHAQEHSAGHGWLRLVTVSLILDFASYFILIVGLKPPKESRLLSGSLEEESIGPPQAFPTLLEGVAYDLEPEILKPIFAFELSFRVAFIHYYTVTYVTLCHLAHA